jgi:molecular chaperone Hsp33
LGEGEFYRSSVELVDFDLPLDLERYFLSSEQVPSALVMGVSQGLLVQALPNGDQAALARIAGRARDGGMDRALAQAPQSAARLLSALVDGEGTLEPMTRYDLRFQCGCSMERVHKALVTLGRAELEDMLAKDGKAEATCEFCNAYFLVTEGDLRTLLAESQTG